MRTAFLASSLALVAALGSAQHVAGAEPDIATVERLKKEMLRLREQMDSLQRELDALEAKPGAPRSTQASPAASSAAPTAGFGRAALFREPVQGPRAPHAARILA